MLSPNLLLKHFITKKTIVVARTSNTTANSLKFLSTNTAMNNPKQIFATADLCDEHISSPQRLSIAEPCLFESYGKVTCFHGQIETIRCFESNPLVKETLGESGNDRVLVVDGGGSKRCAILGTEYFLLLCTTFQYFVLLVIKYP